MLTEVFVVEYETTLYDDDHVRWFPSCDLFEQLDWAQEDAEQMAEAPEEYRNIRIIRFTRTEEL